VALEQEFEEIRVPIKAPGEPLPSQRDRAGDMTAAYFQGPERGAAGLDGMERLLARLKIDRGLWNMTLPGALRLRKRIANGGGLANNAAMFRDHGGTRRQPQGHTLGSICGWSDDSFQPQAKAKQIERLLEQVARHNGMERRDLPSPTADVASPVSIRRPSRFRTRARDSGRDLELAVGGRCVRAGAAWPYRCDAAPSSQPCAYCRHKPPRSHEACAGTDRSHERHRRIPRGLGRNPPRRCRGPRCGTRLAGF
jgi:hypothetical protein